MAFLQCNFKSEVLGFNTTINVILPQKTKSEMIAEGNYSTKKLPVLFLLHGLCGDHTSIFRFSSFERYVAAYGLAVVAPNVHRSFYTDMTSGGNYWSFVSEELPRIARAFFPLSDAREYNFVAGISMGGYGALKLAMRCPDQYAAAASISGVVDIVNIINNFKILNKKEWENIFGELEKVEGSENDLFHLVSGLAAGKGLKPKLYQCCGTEDYLYNSNIKFRDICKMLPVDLTYEEEKGTHEWSYWERKIQSVLQWLPLKNR